MFILLILGSLILFALQVIFFPLHSHATCTPHNSILFFPVAVFFPMAVSTIRLQGIQVGRNYLINLSISHNLSENAFLLVDL